MYNKFKDCDPLETSNKFAKILNDIGLDISITFKKICDEVNSCAINVNDMGFGTNGKGTNEVYCLASGLGELFERLQAKLIFDKMDICRCYDKDEIYLDFEEAIEQYPELIEDAKWSYEYDKTDKFSLDKYKKLCDYMWSLKSGKLRCIPVYSYKDKVVKYVPYDLMRAMSGSNGSAAGNTFEEATLQALCEIFERYSGNQIIENDLTPPRIPYDWIKKKSPDNYRLLEKLKKITHFDFMVFDNSLGKGIPAVSVLMIDKKNKRYTLNVGCHPIFNIALERAIEEIFQGIGFEDLEYFGNRLKSIYDNYSDLKDAKNLDARFRNGSAIVPYNLFMKNGSWKFKDWSEDEETFTNKLGVKKLKDLALKLGASNIYIRNLAFLGVPAVYIYIPKISKMTVRNFGVIKQWKILNKLRYENLDISDDYKKECLEFLENQKISLGLKYDKESLIAAIYNDFKESEKAKEHILKSTDTFAKIVFKEIELKTLGYSEEERTKYLNLFFERDEIDFVERFWRSNKTFERLLKICSLKNTKIEENRKKLKNKIKDLIDKSNINQAEIGKIFDQTY